MILEESGVFWWSGEKTPDGEYAPSSAVHGQLKVGDDGSVSLELSETLTRDSGLSDLINDDALLERDISGRLSSNANSVRLFRSSRSKLRLRFPGVAVESFRALYCVIGNGLPDANANDTIFSQVLVTLDGFEHWFNRPGVSVADADGVWNFTAASKRIAEYNLSVGSFIFDENISWSMTRAGTGISIDAHQHLLYTPPLPVNIEGIIQFTGSIEDLLVLLSDTEAVLSWPKIRHSPQDRWCDLYYPRIKRDSTQENESKNLNILCWADYASLSRCFGHILQKWLTAKTDARSAINQYSSTRRGLEMFTEHRFMSLVWGLEALHRNVAESVTNQRLQHKIERILDAVLVNDRRWLTKRLQSATEPPLAHRIEYFVRRLPLKVTKEDIATFAEACA